MANPVLVEVTRGSRVESRHRGVMAIFDADGATVASVGDISGPVFPRSAIKAFQALPLVESGAADAMGLESAELALACSSHNGEEIHVNTARVMLMKAGLDADALECGPQPPALEDDQAALHRAGACPCQLHNNCSGKHAGFLGLARTLGVATEGYVAPDHPVQREVKAVMEEMCGTTLDADLCGIDGCSAPTWAVPIDGLARGFAMFGTGQGLGDNRAAAARELYDACTENPLMVAGTDRFCTRVMTAFGGRVFVKTGAEGVFCGAIPELGLGIALKCDDGATRAAETMMAGILDTLLETTDAEAAALAPSLKTDLRNRRNTPVGQIRTVEGFREMIHG